MLDDLSQSEHYMQLREEEKSKPALDLTDPSYSYIDTSEPDAVSTDIEMVRIPIVGRSYNYEGIRRIIILCRMIMRQSMY